ncbi:hypothetical protein WJX74_000690 [Apatococcus lobatus]|uniref:Rotatin n=1 Tax=Apatococcus lobatus TaxID=904363 RepID=A0AAW1S5C3_9CHLO
MTYPAQLKAKLAHPLPEVQLRSARSLLFKLKHRLVDSNDLGQADISALTGALRTTSCPPLIHTLVEAIQQIAAMPGMASLLITCNCIDTIHAVAESEMASVRATCKTIEALLLAAPPDHQSPAQQESILPAQQKECHMKLKAVTRKLDLDQAYTAAHKENDSGQSNMADFAEVGIDERLARQQTRAGCRMDSVPALAGSAEGNFSLFEGCVQLPATSISAQDDQHLFDLLIRLQFSQEAMVVLQAVEALHGDIQIMAAPEVLLQRPAGLQALLHLLDHPDPQSLIPYAVLRLLQSLVNRFKQRLLLKCDGSFQSGPELLQGPGNASAEVSSWNHVNAKASLPDLRQEESAYSKVTLAAHEICLAVVPLLHNIRFHPASMSFMSEVMPLLSLHTAQSWNAEEVRYVQSHFSSLGSALASAMQFALAEACSSQGAHLLQGQPNQQLPGMLDAAGAGILQVIISFVQQCPTEVFLKVVNSELMSCLEVLVVDEVACNYVPAIRAVFVGLLAALNSTAARAVTEAAAAQSHVGRLDRLLATSCQVGLDDAVGFAREACAVLAGLHYLHPAEAASAAHRLTAALLGHAVGPTSQVASHEHCITAAAATLVSLASHEQPEVRQACFQCITSQACEASQCLESSAHSSCYSTHAAQAKAASLLCLLLQPELWSCIMTCGLSDPFTGQTAAKIVHCCAAAVSGSCIGMSGPANALQQAPGQDSSPATWRSMHASACPGSSADGQSGCELGGIQEFTAQEHGQDAVPIHAGALSAPAEATAATAAVCLLADCGMQLMESVPQLTCYLHLGSHVTDALTLIGTWQQHQTCTISSIEGSLKKLVLLHSLQQLFHSVVSVRAAAVMHVQILLSEWRVPCNAAAAWNESFEDLMSALALSGSRSRPAMPNLSSSISDKDAANLMDIMQRTDLGEDIAGSAADQLISHVSGGCMPVLLSHPSFLEHLLAQAGQLAVRPQMSSPLEYQELPAMARLPKAALELLAQITQKSHGALSFLVSNLMRSMTTLAPLVFSRSSSVSRHAAMLLQLVCFAPLASKGTAAPKPPSAKLAPDLQLSGAFHQTYMLPMWKQQATREPCRSPSSALLQHKVVMRILDQRRVISHSAYCASPEPSLPTGLGRSPADGTLLEAMSQKLNMSQLAAKAFKAVELAGCHDECLAALHHLQLLCATQRAAGEVAAMGWFQSLQHLLQAAPITLDDKELWAVLLELVCTLLATGQTSAHACQLLLVALRSSALEWLAAPASVAAPGRAPLALCNQGSRPMLGDLQEALLNAHLTQAVMETMAMTLQAAILQGMGRVAFGLVDGTGLIQTLVDGYVASAAATSTQRLWAVIVISTLVETVHGARGDDQHLSTSPGQQDVSTVLSWTLQSLLRHVCMAKMEERVIPTHAAQQLQQTMMQCLKLIMAALTTSSWSLAWAEVGGCWWLMRMARDEDAVVRAAAWEMLVLLIQPDAHPTLCMLLKACPDVATTALKAVMDGKECSGVRAAAIQFLCMAMVDSEAAATTDLNPDDRQLPGLWDFGVEAIIRNLELWASLSDIMQDETAPPRLHAAAIACLLQLGLADPTSLGKQLGQSSSPWQSILKLLTSDPGQQLQPLLSLPVEMGWFMPVQSHRAALSRQHFFAGSPPVSLGQRAASQSDHNRMPQYLCLQQQQFQHAQQQALPSCQGCQALSSQDSADNWLSKMPRATQHFNMVLHIADMISAAMYSPQLCQGSKDDAADSAVRSTPSQDTGTQLDANQKQPLNSLEVIAGPVLEALMTSLSEAAATCLRLSRSWRTEDRQQANSLMQLIEQNYHTAALHLQAEFAVTACCEAAACLLASMPDLSTSQIAFAVTCCQQACWLDGSVMAERSAPGSACQSSPQGCQSSQQHMVDLHLQRQAPQSAQYNALAQMQDVHVKPAQITAQITSCDENRANSMAGMDDPKLENFGQLAPGDALGCISAMLLDNQTCKPATQIALCRLVASLLSTQDTANALLAQPPDAESTSKSPRVAVALCHGLLPLWKHALQACSRCLEDDWQQLYVANAALRALLAYSPAAKMVALKLDFHVHLMELLSAAAAAMPDRNTHARHKKAAGLHSHTAAPSADVKGQAQENAALTKASASVRQIGLLLGMVGHFVHESEAAGHALMLAGLGQFLDQLWQPGASREQLHHILCLLVRLLPSCQPARAALSTKRGPITLLERAVKCLADAGEDATFHLAASALRSLSAAHDGAAQLLRSTTFLSEGRRLLQSLLQGKQWKQGCAILQVYVNLAASPAGQKQLFQSPAAAGLGDQVLCWACSPCTDCMYEALLMLRNLAFCTENHAHFLAAPRMLPVIVSRLSERDSHLPLAAAASSLWTLAYHSEKIKAALRKLPDLALHLGTAEYQTYKYRACIRHTPVHKQSGLRGWVTSRLSSYFRRLLKCCEDIVGGDNKGRADLKTWSTSPVFHHYVETLQEQLADLKLTSEARSRPEDYASYDRQAVPHQPRQPRVMPPEKLAHRMERHSPQQSAAALNADTRQLLGRQDHLQDAMIDEMADLAASLKNNVLGIENSVKTRGQLLEDTETALEHSAAGAKQSNQQAKTVRTKSSRSFCATLMWLLLVGMVFVGMYIFIKATSMAGYKYVKPKPIGGEL